MIFQINLETGHGALSVDFKGSYSGFYAKEGQTWLISGNKRKPYSQYLPYEYVKSCNKEYQAAPHDLHYVPQITSNDLEKPSKRLRREAEDKYIELIIVVSNGLVRKYESKNATDKTSRLRPVFHRYESVHNIIDNFYKMVGIRVALLDIVLWDERDHVNMQERNSGDILDKFRAWRKKQTTDMALSSDQRLRWKAQDNAQLVVVSKSFRKDNNIIAFLSF